ncbi:ectoine hydroxylase-related dioxygenase (phytanoyl-CoA dioxygenase family) [Rhizobium aethiopicum]|uniref:phytanoyl-CoA dioxygenase family protein n=1 Tax=Rhizobium aethiopicum TaxID=1138170 RepID=UPI001612CE3D|nr:phytanoyl-CoA dioxygenase family protein [Rhizobium aethiopicum]MBB4583520.1 ectoine hydroxylase-related dioxygenase (phytanoyl-CoA dioxygenase family) [Rhizobium aethiopicum]
MNALHLPSTSSAEIVAAAVREHGYAIVDDLVSNELLDRIAREMAPYVENSMYGTDDFSGKLTRRTGALIARSPAARELVMNPLALGTVETVLSHATTFQLHLTQIISVSPGSPPQELHKDELAWDFFPFPLNYDVQCNILWALSDYTEEMGATRVVPGSHRSDRKDYTQSDTIAAAMRRGSALFYSGKVYHGAGANKSDRLRQAVNVTYAVGWLRQEENQYLTTPIEIARTLPEELLKVMGYQLGCFAMGYVGDAEDPLTVLRPNQPRSVMNTGIMAKQAAHNDAAANFMSQGRD